MKLSVKKFMNKLKTVHRRINKFIVASVGIQDKVMIRHKHKTIIKRVITNDPHFSLDLPYLYNYLLYTHHIDLWKDPVRWMCYLLNRSRRHQHLDNFLE